MGSGYYGNYPACLEFLGTYADIPPGAIYYEDQGACFDHDYSSQKVKPGGNPFPSGPIDPPSPIGVVGETITLLNNVIESIAGKRRSILSNIQDDIAYLQTLVSNVGDNLAISTRTLSDQLERARENLNRSITNAVNDINAHADQNTGTILEQMATDHSEVMGSLDRITKTLDDIPRLLESALAGIGEALASALKEANKDLVRQVDISLDLLGRKIESAIELQGQRISYSIDRMGDAVDRLNATLDRIGTLIVEELGELRETLRVGLEAHGKLLDRAIRESGAGIAAAIAADTAVDTAGYALLAAAMEANAITISAAIESANAARMIAEAPKLLKEIEMLGILLPILTAVGGLLTLSNPNEAAKVISEIVNLYYDLGKAVTLEQAVKKE